MKKKRFNLWAWGSTWSVVGAVGVIVPSALVLSEYVNPGSISNQQAQKPASENKNQNDTQQPPPPQNHNCQSRSNLDQIKRNNRTHKYRHQNKKRSLHHQQNRLNQSRNQSQMITALQFRRHLQPQNQMFLQLKKLKRSWLLNTMNKLKMVIKLQILNTNLNFLHFSSLD